MSPCKKCESLSNADADKLAMLTDPEPITAEWLKDEGWIEHPWGLCKSLNRETSIVFEDISTVYIQAFEYDGDEYEDVDSMCLQHEIKTRGQLRCLIIGLGGEA